MEKVKWVNRYLKDHYGISVNGRPRFRVVWSDSLHETRKGIFSELAIAEEVREVPKYAYLKERFILEIDTLAYQDVFGKAITEKDKVVVKGDGYEPLRVFQTRKGEYLPPDIEICKIICDKWVELVNRPEGQRLTRKQATAQDAEDMKVETAKFFDILTQQDSDLIHKFRDQEAIILPGKELN